ncbi:MAG: molybdopterin molybdotransferase MoeA [Desulfurococcaceae archaeon]
MTSTGFYSSLINVDRAIELATSFIRELDIGVEKINVWSGLNRIIAEDIYAERDQPCCLKSYVDGYAVKASDIQGASFSNPVRLFVKGLLKPGENPSKYVLKNGEAVEVYTGSPLPIGSDTVVMYEDVVRDGDYIDVFKTLSVYSNVAQIGEDYRKGDLLVSRRTVLKPQHLAIIASSGLFEISVYEKIRIGLICTGSEVLDKPVNHIDYGVYNSTCILVKNMVEQLGFTEIKYYGTIPDETSIIDKTLSKALSENHVLITCGGAGFSENDVLSRIVDRKGFYVFRGVALRPGKPTSLAILNNKPVFLLSGFPVAAWCGLEAIVIPVIHKLMGVEPPFKPCFKTILKRNVPNVIGYRSYVRVKIYRVKDELYSEPYGLRGSGVLSSLVKTNGFIIIPEDCEGYSEGSIVDTYLY